MEIMNVKQNLIPPSQMEPTPRPLTVLEQSGKQAKKGEAAKELVKAISSGNEEGVKGIIESINRVMTNMRYSLQFIVDREEGTISIKVVDSEGKLIRRIPPEVMAELSSGLGADIGVLLNTQL